MGSERLRVLHIVSAARGYGAEAQVMRLLPYLKREDVDVGLLAVYGSKMSPEERARLPFSIIEGERRGRGDYLFLPRLVRKIRSFGPDIVHTHTHVGKYWGRAAALAAGVRTVVHTEHNPCDPRRNPLERTIDPLLHAFTARVVTFFSEQRAFLSRVDRLEPEKIVVIPNGMEIPSGDLTGDRLAARERLGVKPDEYAVMVIGRLEYQKNHDLALRALAATPPEFRKRIRMFFAGAGILEERLRELSTQLAEDLHDEARVEFLGYRDDVQLLMSGADLVLMTSHFEGMPLVLIETMIAGVPILSTPWIGAGTMLGHGRFGFIAPGWSPEALSEEMHRALTRESARATVVSHARKYARSTYDIRAMATAHRRLYQALAGTS